uniref:Kazal-like domain-containing protein n=1 Tax=Paramormyrops kingsleyae TaxID=1676925 RepID=A0A3B3SW70_9TELE
EEKTRRSKPPCEILTGLVYCPTHAVPVCGTDGKTYNNMCDLCNYMARTKENILVTKRGKC